MEPVEVYMTYCAIKAHFSRESYDYHKYGGKTKTNKMSFYKRNDRLFFARIARKYPNKKDVEEYFVSNFLADKNGYIKNFSEDNYLNWKKRIQSLTYNLTNEISPYADRFEELFKWEDQHPILLKEYLGKRISIETMAILDDLVGYIKNWDDTDIIWKDHKKMVEKYKKFLTIDTKKCKVALMKVIK